MGIHSFILTLKAPVTNTADDILFYFSKKNCESSAGIEDSHEMSRLIFSEKKNRMSSAAAVILYL